MVLLKKSLKLSVAFLVVIGMVGFFLGSHLGDDPNQPRYALTNFIFFSLGLVCALLNIRSRVTRNWIITSGVFALVGLTGYLNNFRENLFWHYYGPLLAITLTTIGLFFRIGGTWTNVFARCGKYCFGIYAYSSLIGVVLQIYDSGHGLAAFLLQLLALPISYCSYKYFERPIQTRGKLLLGQFLTRKIKFSS